MKKRSIPVVVTTVAAIGSLFFNTHSSRAAEALPQDGSDARFVQKAAQSGMAELRTAKMGAKNASSAAVRAFAEMLVKDHTKVNEQIKELAAAKGIKLDVDSSPEEETGKNLEEQSSLFEGSKFKSTDSPSKVGSNKEQSSSLEGRMLKNTEAPKVGNTLVAGSSLNEGRMVKNTRTPTEVGNRSDQDDALIEGSKGKTIVAPTEAGKKVEEGSVSDFDKQFLASMIKSHKREINAYQDASEDCKDADVKAFAATTLSILKAHLSKAQELNGEGTDANPENTRINLRDRDSDAVTPFDQGNSEADIQRTAQIRREVVALDTVSSTAKNVKIITKDGHVTLRGPVDSADEKKTIREIAARVATEEHVTDELEVKLEKEDK